MKCAVIILIQSLVSIASAQDFAVRVPLGENLPSTATTLQIMAQPTADSAALEPLQRIVDTHGLLALVFETPDFSKVAIFGIRHNPQATPRWQTRTSFLTFTNTANLPSHAAQMRSLSFAQRWQTYQSQSTPFETRHVHGSGSAMLSDFLYAAHLAAENFFANDEATLRAAVTHYQLPLFHNRFLSVTLSSLYEMVLESSGYQVNLNHPRYWAYTGIASPQAREILAAGRILISSDHVFINGTIVCERPHPRFGQLRGPRIYPMGEIRPYLADQTNNCRPAHVGSLNFDRVNRAMRAAGYEFRGDDWIRR